MKDKFLVRLINTKNEKMIRAFQTLNITELLNLYLVAKENEIEIDIPINEKNDEYSNKIAYVKDIRITFGDNETFTCLNVYVEVMY